MVAAPLASHLHFRLARLLRAGGGLGCVLADSSCWPFRDLLWLLLVIGIAALILLFHLLCRTWPLLAAAARRSTHGEAVTSTRDAWAAAWMTARSVASSMLAGTSMRRVVPAAKPGEIAKEAGPCVHVPMPMPKPHAPPAHEERRFLLLGRHF